MYILSLCPTAITVASTGSISTLSAATTPPTPDVPHSRCRICYAPRLPEPYLVPESMAIDTKKGIFRRQADLGNLVQLAEAMKCFHIVAGVSPLWGGYRQDYAPSVQELECFGQGSPSHQYQRNGGYGDRLSHRSDPIHDPRHLR